MAVVDVDQHLYETRDLWFDHCDPQHRDDALRIADDELGYPWLTWRGERIAIADVQHPGDTAALGRTRNRQREGRPPEYDYDATLPDAYWEPRARVGALDTMGVDDAVCFPNFGLLWERPLSGDLPALCANLTAWNRWCATVVADGAGRVHPVAHLTLRDADWCRAQLGELARSGVRAAMIAPAAVDGRPLSHPDHDAIWHAFVDTGVTPLFHVANQPRVLDDAWYTDADDSFVPVMESVFLWTPPAVAITDMIVNGVFERVPGLRVGIIELGAIWVPMYLMMLDGGYDFTAKLNGRVPTPLSARPAEIFVDHVRVAAFSYERPARLIAAAGDVFMACSDYPHSEGTASPLADYAAGDAGVQPAEAPGLFGANADFLLGR